MGPVLITKNRTVLLERLEEIDVYGGGNCPEMALGGINKAIEASLPQSYIYVLTDATPADHFLVRDTLDLLLRKQIQIVFVLTGECPGDKIGKETFEKIAAASSGQVFHLNKSNVSKVLDFVRDTLDSRRVSLISINNLHANQTNENNLTVDTTLEQLTISVSGKNATINVINPAGEILKPPKQLQTILDLENIQVRRNFQFEFLFNEDWIAGSER